jgi:hypothetical protein
MKKLFCTVVTDPTGFTSLESPIVFHTRCEDQDRADDNVREILVDDYSFEPECVDNFDIFTFEVSEDEIIELD